jgi:hypothetical protein
MRAVTSTVHYIYILSLIKRFLHDYALDPPPVLHQPAIYKGPKFHGLYVGHRDHLRMWSRSMVADVVKCMTREGSEGCNARPSSEEYNEPSWKQYSSHENNGRVEQVARKERWFVAGAVIMSLYDSCCQSSDPSEYRVKCLGVQETNTEANAYMDKSTSGPWPRGKVYVDLPLEWSKGAAGANEPGWHVGIRE